MAITAGKFQALKLCPESGSIIEASQWDAYVEASSCDPRRYWKSSRPGAMATAVTVWTTTAFLTLTAYEPKPLTPRRAPLRFDARASLCAGYHRIEARARKTDRSLRAVA